MLLGKFWFLKMAKYYQIIQLSGHTGCNEESKPRQEAKIRSPGTFDFRLSGLECFSEKKLSYST